MNNERAPAGTAAASPGSGRSSSEVHAMLNRFLEQSNAIEVSNPGQPLPATASPPAPPQQQPQPQQPQQQPQPQANESAPPANLVARKQLDLIVEKVKGRYCLIQHLDRVLKQLGMKVGGVKKEKQERIITKVVSELNKKDFAQVRRIYEIVATFCPTEENTPQIGLIRGNAPAPQPNLRNNATGVIGEIYSNGHRAGGYPVMGGTTMAGSTAPQSQMRSQLFGTTAPPQARPKTNPLRPTLRFKPSPFYTLLDSVSNTASYIKPHKRKVTHSLQFVARLMPCRYYLVSQQLGRGDEPQYIEFPFYLEVEINGKEVKLNTRGVRGLPGSTKPADITDHLKMGSANIIKVTMHDSEPGGGKCEKSFLMGIFSGIKTSMARLLEIVDSKPHLLYNSTVEYIQKSNAEDQDIQSSDIVYSLKDKVMMTRIKMPIRSKKCTHIECFDAESFFLLQEQAETSKCPVCNRVIDFDSLAVCDYFQEILKKCSGDTVVVNVDGTWTPPNDSHNNVASNADRDDSSDSSSEEIEVVDLLSDSEDTQSEPQLDREINRFVNENGIQSRTPAAPAAPTAPTASRTSATNQVPSPANRTSANTAQPVRPPAQPQPAPQPRPAPVSAPAQPQPQPQRAQPQPQPPQQARQQPVSPPVQSRPIVTPPSNVGTQPARPVQPQPTPQPQPQPQHPAQPRPAQPVNQPSPAPAPAPAPRQPVERPVQNTPRATPDPEVPPLRGHFAQPPINPRAYEQPPSTTPAAPTRSVHASTADLQSMLPPQHPRQPPPPTQMPPAKRRAPISDSEGSDTGGSDSQSANETPNTTSNNHFRATARNRGMLFPSDDFIDLTSE